MRAYPYEKRCEVIDKFRQGWKRKEISQHFSLNYKTVSCWIRAFQKDGYKGLGPQYDKCGGHFRTCSTVRDRVVEMKRLHPGWGANYIRMKIKQTNPKWLLPSARQMQRYFRQAGLIKQRTCLGQDQGATKWAKIPLHRVQVDAKEQLKTLDGQWCSYLTFTDERSGAVLEALVFPPQVYPSSRPSGCL